ncbi:MAG: AMP-binding protein, partial [Pigmentiphaga sp.]
MSLKEGDELWRPSAQQASATCLASFMTWLRQERELSFDDYDALWRWSVNDLDAFWRAIWDYFDIQADGSPEPVLASRSMPGARWFPAARLNYAEHVFRQRTPERPALLARGEGNELRQVSWEELEHAVGALAATLKALGVQAGDRVASFMPNVPETVIAFLACASIGAVWSSCSPEMGASVVLDRFQQIEAKVLFAVDSYTYNGKLFDRRDVVRELLDELPTVQQVIHVVGPAASAQPDWRGYRRWEASVSDAAPLVFERVPFEHPLWIVYSSGTTGLPKAMVHGHGGIVL